MVDEKCDVQQHPPRGFAASDREAALGIEKMLFMTWEAGVTWYDFDLVEAAQNYGEVTSLGARIIVEGRNDPKLMK